MKYLLILLLFVLNIYADDTKQKITIGLGPYIQTQPYKDVAAIFVLSPVIFFDNSLFYIRWSRFGMYFLGSKGKEFSWGLSLTAQPRTFGYESSDSSTVIGMDERENSFEGGVAFSASYNDAYLEIMALSDVLSRHDTWLLKAELGDEYNLGDFTFYPSAILTYQSDEFVNYYYGVKAEEAARTSYGVYTPKGGLQIGVQTFINYDINDKFSVLANLRADQIPQSAKNSPLIDESTIYSGLLSLIYTFEY
ncbi:MipA/OmpV family protein [Sulfurimonas aquatica]|uniref:MipA/OmpV family protein n=1 Tax=Sulfurimonas aquatica TaxID=2672570 RepID=A0A975GCF5_9BACT|nr:MipA/OmpV family protein [Sulfurimonas aquatica]QSZ41452.1 MipA/OmpV family protein [Sulfurimonas aquatica]